MEATTFALPATPRQIAYARSLALRNQTLLPWEIQQDRRSLSAWIDAQAQGVDLKTLRQIRLQGLRYDHNSGGGVGALQRGYQRQRGCNRSLKRHRGSPDWNKDKPAGHSLCPPFGLAISRSPLPLKPRNCRCAA